MAENVLYYGDNLDILRRYVKDESVDLVYLDPPFNSNANYNVLFAEKDGKRSAAQIKAFEDTWEWDEASARALWEVIQHGGKPAQAMQAFRILLGDSDMLAYLAMMAPRLIELHRVLKPTGSLFLHCDPTASHYLKILMDTIFGPRNFRNEVVWRRTRGHNDERLTRFGSVHDVLLYYSKSDQRTFNKMFLKRDPNAANTHDLYKHTDGQLYRKGDCRAPGGRGPRYEWHGHVQHWRFTQEKAQELEAQGLIVYSASGMPRVLRPVDLTRGSPLTDVWVDIDAPNSGSGELLGYPTQKPEALLDRVITASSNEGDVVLDPFCGCGTAVIAAQKLKRRWVGIDVTHLAVGLMKSRLRDSFGPDIAKAYSVIGEPTTLPDAIKLAEEDKFQFQAWALGQVDARLDTSAKKGADKGIDGRLYFHEGDNKPRQVILSVKGGHTDVKDMRDLGHVVNREGADIGVLITLQEPTGPMRTEAVDAGFYVSPWGQHPRLQILTIKELLAGKKIDMPQTRGINVTFKQAPKAKVEVGVAQRSLLDDVG